VVGWRSGGMGRKGTGEEGWRDRDIKGRIGMHTNSANPPAMTSFDEPMALRPAERAKGTVSPSLRP